MRIAYTMASVMTETDIQTACQSPAAEHRETATVEQARQRRQVVGTRRPCRAILAAGEEAEGQRPPDAADPVRRHPGDRVVGAKRLEVTSQPRPSKALPEKASSLAK